MPRPLPHSPTPIKGKGAQSTTLFISDLHLDPERPEITRLFGQFLESEAREAQALYILGDLFEAWIGDDDDAPLAQEVAGSLRALHDAGVRVYFIHGNRDFLLGHAYAARAGMRLLPDPSVIMLHGEPVLLMHGDTLCTDDVAYQAFRAQSRAPGWREAMLAQPLAVRRALAGQARTTSQAHQQALKTGDRARFETITDVSPQTVESTFIRYGINTLIHGHTHRPAVHQVQAGDAQCTRIVLGDWYEQGSVLRVDAEGWQLSVIA